jgi:hypothetical protein
MKKFICLAGLTAVSASAISESDRYSMIESLILGETTTAKVARNPEAFLNTEQAFKHNR